ncbi:hypothetical protein [Humibacter albus]|uniref:hypothetical protein n=1 Tax=Humibacter albus TaxID=427754 RepID=UPI0003B5313E|nr:hypothetical protein [Humibacter albus]
MSNQDEGIHIEPSWAEGAIPAQDEEARSVDEIGEPDPLPEEDVEAEEQEDVEAAGHGVEEEAQPETQGEDPYESALGDEGEGDLAPEDL